MQEFILHEDPCDVDNLDSSSNTHDTHDQSTSSQSSINQGVLPLLNVSSSSHNIQNAKQTKITDDYFPKEINKKRQELVSNCIANFIAKDMMAISVIEGNGFIEMMSTIVPGYKVPSRSAIKKRIETIYQLEQRRVKKMIDNLSYVSLTTDCWSSRSIESYYTVTAHGIDSNWNFNSFVLCTSVMTERHTGENLKNKLVETLYHWDIMNKTVSIAHDNAANIICTMRLLKNEPGAQDIDSVHCFAHTMQCSINAGLQIDHIKTILDTCKSIVSHFKHSNVAYDAYRNFQNTSDTPKRKLIQFVKTRWNSVYHMVDRLIEQRSSITAVLNNRAITSSQIASGLEIAERDWLFLEELRDCLKPFELATKIMSSESSPTASIVQPLIYSIRENFLQLKSDDSSPLREFKSTVKKDFVTRFSTNRRYDQSLMGNSQPTLLDICTFFDPRYKKFERDMGISNRIKELLKELINNDLEYFDNQDPNHDTEEKRTAFDFLFPTDNQILNNSCEVTIYVEEPQIDKNNDPVLWWQKNEIRFPKLAKIAKKYLSVPGTSTAAERAFSKAGNIITAKRNCLSGKTADMLIFLAHNTKVQ